MRARRASLLATARTAARPREPSTSAGSDSEVNQTIGRLYASFVRNHQRADHASRRKKMAS
jgi:hypothetical protein